MHFKQKYLTMCLPQADAEAVCEGSEKLPIFMVRHATLGLLIPQSIVCCQSYHIPLPVVITYNAGPSSHDTLCVY